MIKFCSIFKKISWCCLSSLPLPLLPQVVSMVVSMVVFHWPTILLQNTMYRVMLSIFQLLWATKAELTTTQNQSSRQSLLQLSRPTISQPMLCTALLWSTAPQSYTHHTSTALHGLMLTHGNKSTVNWSSSQFFQNFKHIFDHNCYHSKRNSIETTVICWSWKCQQTILKITMIAAYLKQNDRWNFLNFLKFEAFFF